MNRAEFEMLRDLPGKVIRGDIKFSRKQALAQRLVAEDLVSENTAGVELRMAVHSNPATTAKTINVHVPGTGPICRLDIDGTVHGAAGRSHKHSLQTGRCPDRNLPDGVVARPELAGKSPREVFESFCELAGIVHDGSFHEPDPRWP